MDQINFMQREKTRLYPEVSREKAFAFSLEELEGMLNQITTRDAYSNKILNEMLEKFLEKDFESSNYLKDNFIQILDYTVGALEKISKNPKLKLEKISELQDINKVTQTDFKTMMWLSSKPGKTIIDKIGIGGKILAPKNIYSVDKKENRIVNFYFKKVHQILERRNDALKIRNEEIPKEFKELCKRFHRIKRNLISNEIYSLKRPLDFEPNNTLIDHRDYSVVNRGLKIFNNSIEKAIVNTDKILMMAISVVFFKIINKLSKVENMKILSKPVKIEKILIGKEDNFELFYEGNTTYRIKASLNQETISFEITELEFDKKSKISIKNKESENKIVLNFKISNIYDEYLIFLINNNQYILNQQGTLEAIDKVIDNIFKKIGRVSFKEKKYKEKYKENIYFNFNSIIPSYNNTLIKETSYDETNNNFLKFDDYNYLDNKLSKINSFRNLLRFVKNFKENEKISSKNIVIYPSIENLDTETHKEIYSILKSNFSKSYPIWRSILAAYSVDFKSSFIKENDIYFVLDLNSPSPSINIIQKKNMIYEHHPASLEVEFDSISLDKFLNDYLDSYLIKNNLKIDNWKKKNLLETGKVYDCISNDKKHIILQKNEMFLLEKDDEILKKIIFSFKEIIQSKIEKYFKNSNLKKKNLIIICDYLDEFKNLDMDIKIIKELELGLGKDIIIEKIQKNKIVWNEFLPNLSLETIKDNHFYELDLIKDKSINLTLDSELIITVDEQLILPAKNEVIYFPLHSQDTFNKKIYLLEIKSDQFPLEKELVVNLKIGYSYATEDPYRIIIEPVDLNEKLEIKSRWLEKTNEFKIKKIEFPEVTNLVTIQEIKDTMSRIERAADLNKLDNLADMLNKNKNRFRKYIAQEINNNNISHILDDVLIKSDHILLTKLNSETVSDDLKNKIKLFLSSFGAYTNYIIPFSLKENKNYQKRCALFFYKLNNKKFSHIYRNSKEQIHAISEIAWLDKEFMFELAKREPNIIKSCLYKIENILEELDKRFEEIYNLKKDRGWFITNDFRDCLEFILAVLMISDKIPMNKKNIYLMLNNIKSIDRRIQTNSRYSNLKGYFEKNIRVTFELEKKNDLSNMSDLAYSVYNLITGDDGSDSIKISGLTDND